MNKNIIFIIGIAILFIAGGWLLLKNGQIFPPQEIEVTVYFGNSRENPNAQDCRLVYPVKRTAKLTGSDAETAFRELIGGPTQAEKDQGYYSWFSAQTADALLSLKIENGTAYVNLKDIRNLISGASSSCGSAEFLSETETTLKQFPGVSRVIFAYDGNPSDFYEWIQFGCAKENDYCNQAPFLDKGTIEGSLGYPSETIPSDMRVCAENIASEKKYCTDEQISDSKYTYGKGYRLELPVGEYYVFAKITNTEYPAYWSQYVVCGFKQECTSHMPIKVTVQKDKLAQNIDPQDWYYATVSQNPDFEDTGNLVSGSQKKWALLYEEPGSPALKVDLNFTDTSLCDMAKGQKMCLADNQNIWEAGERITVSGRKNSGSVDVFSLVSDKSKSDMIRPQAPLFYEVIKSPLKIRGLARGNWYFEAVFPILLLDANGNPATASFATSKSDWMTTQFVEFGSEITFDMPSTANGTLILRKDNPSGLPEFDDQLEIPVFFREGKITGTEPPTNTPAEISYGNRDVKQVIFTFDAGAGNNSVNAILDVLEDYGLKGTFFLTGKWAEQYPEELRKISQAGHEIFNHTYSHPYLTQLSAEEIAQELQKADDVIRSITGKSTKPYFRPPYGDRNQRVWDAAFAAGYRSVYWTIDVLDWQEESGYTDQQAKDRIFNNLQQDGIYLMHVGDNITGRILGEVFSRLKNMGYEISSLTEGIS